MLQLLNLDLNALTGAIPSRIADLSMLNYVLPVFLLNLVYVYTTTLRLSGWGASDGSVANVDVQDGVECAGECLPDGRCRKLISFVN